MLFNSFTFPVFLLVIFSVFIALPLRLRWAWLLAASCVFYGFEQPFNLVYLGAVTAVTYVCGRAMGSAAERRSRTAWLVIGLVAVLGGLVTFKFHDFLAGEVDRLLAFAFNAGPGPIVPRLGIVTPVGYSFYAFMAASYLIDVYCGRLQADRGAGNVALYIAFFPKILAGPIERAGHFLPQLGAGLRTDPERLTTGLQLICWGLVKKVVIADNLAPLVDRTFKIAAYAAPMDLLLGVYFFAFQIYCDFSGYTDIAIGVALLFGIRLMENFRKPYLSKSTSEFWGERWHISLGHWFRDYLYIPLGGGQAGVFRRYANVMLVFVVSGLWHAGLGYGVGWTFLVWGALNGFYQWAGLATRAFWRSAAARLPGLARSRLLLICRVLLTFHLIAVAWVFFRASSIADALLILKKIWLALPTLPGLIVRYPFSGEQLLGFALIGFLLAAEIIDERRPVSARLSEMPRALRWSVYYAGILALLILGRWQSREFIYMQF